MRDQLVAVKVFKVDAPPEQAEQIADALQAVVQALPRHRGLVEFIAAGVERDTAYLVMAHSDVPSLDSRLKPGAAPDSSAPPVDAEQALVIVRTLAEAMDAAHGRGIVHGGLHPRDIFVDERGACRAAGFGVASALERAGVKVPVRRPYSPPERLTSAPIEPAADRFALGAIAFELLTGRRIAGTGANAAARCTLSLPSADLGALRNALAAMLAEQPGHRPSTASAFATALSFALFPQGVARASAAATSAAAGSDRSPAATARDDRRDTNTAAGLGNGIGAGAIAAGANPPRDNDGPSPDDLELFTREGLFTGQPRQNALRWEPVEVENVVAPDEDPLELFTPESQVESQAAAEPARTRAETAPAVTDAQADAKRDTKTDAGGDATADVTGEAHADVTAEASEPPDTLPDTRPGSILGLSTTIVAPIERAAPPARDERDEDEGEGHETTALPFVPIKADERISPASSRLHDSVLIDDNSRIDVLDQLDRQDRHDQDDRHDQHDQFDRHDRHERADHERADHLDRFDHLDDLDRLDREDHVDEADEAEESITPAAAATAGVIAAAGVTSPAADLTHPSHASHAPHFDAPRADHVHADHAHTDRTPPRFGREADDQWIAPVAEPVTRPASMLTNPQDTPDVGSSVRVVGLVLALGLAVGGAGGYLLGQRSSLRNASTFDQLGGSGDAARPPAGSEQTGAPAAGIAAGAPDASGAAVPGAGGAAGTARTPETPGRSGAAGGNSTTAKPPAAAAGSAASGAAASNAPPGGASSTSGATRPAPATGRLTVSSTPARAEVAIDGERRGVTPLTLRDLPLGSHTVRVTRAGYAPETRRVTVSAGRPAESIAFDLEPIGPRTRPSAPGAGPAATAAAPAPERGSASGLGSLYVVSRPMGARVTIDGRPVGATPLLLTDISPGAHTITLEADGHKPWQTTVQVKMGERARVAGSLEEGR